jgi:hypothetical protein
MRRLWVLTVIAALLVTTAAFAAQPAGLASWWKLAEGSGTSVSDSADGNNGGVYGNATWASGSYGSALSFDGKDGYVVVPDAANLDATRITIEMWVKFASVPYAGIGLNKEGQYRLIAGDVNGTVLSLRYATDTTTWGAGVLAGATPVRAGVWCHAAATYDGAKWVIYLNGKADGEKAESGTLKVNKDTCLVIGAAGGKTFTLDGLIHGVKIWNRALSPDEVKTAFESGKATHGL